MLFAWAGVIALVLWTGVVGDRAFSSEGAMAGKKGSRCIYAVTTSKPHTTATLDLKDALGMCIAVSQSRDATAKCDTRHICFVCIESRECGSSYWLAPVVGETAARRVGGATVGISWARIG